MAISPAFPGSLRAHRFGGLLSGPRLIVLGGVHGNEVCGSLAIERLLTDLDAGSLSIERGQLTLVPVCNPLARSLQRREGERNLNRSLRPRADPQDYEDHVANLLCGWLREHDVLLDLHSFHTAGQPFAMLGPRDNRGILEPFAHAEAEWDMAIHLGPTRLVDGWLEACARAAQRHAQAPDASALPVDISHGVGTTEYMRSQGGYGITLECGQHDDPMAPQVGYQAILQTLALLGMAPVPLQPPAPGFHLLSLQDVTDRLHTGDRLARDWASFDAVRAGEVIGWRHDGQPVCAPADGHVVFPNPLAEPGREWFYFATPGQR